MTDERRSARPLTAIYARVSTSDQDCGAQLRDLRRVALERGWDTVEYIDEGVSGAKTSRPALDRMLEDVRAGRVDIVAAWKLDRVARSTRFLLNLADELKARGVQLVSLRDSIDTTTPSGKFLFVVLAAVAELERDMIRERVQAGLARARDEGRIGGRARKKVDQGRLEALVRAGGSKRAIARELGISVGALQRRLPELLPET